MENSIIYSIYPEQKLIRVSATGHVSFRSILLCLQEVTEDPSYLAGMNCFWDSSQIESVEGSILDFGAAAEMMNNSNIINQSARTAILIDKNKENIEKYTQGFVLMASASNVEHRIFTDINDSELMNYLGLIRFPWLD